MSTQRSLKILVVTKRQYMDKDLLDDHYGRWCELPSALAARGHKVRGLCLSYKPKGDWAGEYQGVLWESLDAGRLKPLGLLRFLGHMRRVARVWQPDVLWTCSDTFYGALARRVWKATGVPYVFDLSDNYEAYASYRLPFMPHFYSEALRDARAVTCVSAPLRGMLIERYGLRDVTVLEMALAAGLFKPLDKPACRKALNLPVDARIFGVAGALKRDRGIEDVFKAFEILAAQDPRVHLALCGPRDVALPAGPRVHDFGMLAAEKVPEFLNALDVSAIANLDSAFGRYCYPQKAREVLACGVPLVAADIPAMREILAARPAQLYPSGDATTLAAAVARLWDAPREPAPQLPTWPDLAVTLEEVLLRSAAPAE